MSVSTIARELPRFIQGKTDSEIAQVRLEMLQNWLREELSPNAFTSILCTIQFPEEFHCLVDWVMSQPEEQKIFCFLEIARILPASWVHEFLKKVPRKDLREFLERVAERELFLCKAEIYFSSTIRLQHFDAMSFLLNSYPSLFSEFASPANLRLAIERVLDDSKENDAIQIFNRLLQLVPRASLITNFHSLLCIGLDGLERAKPFLSEVNAKKFAMVLELYRFIRTQDFDIIQKWREELHPCEWAALFFNEGLSPSGESALIHWIAKNLPEKQQVSIAIEIGVRNEFLLRKFFHLIQRAGFVKEIVSQGTRRLDRAPQEALIQNVFSAVLRLKDFDTAAWLIGNYPSFGSLYATSANVHFCSYVLHKGGVQQAAVGIRVLNRLVERLPAQRTILFVQEISCALERAEKFLSEPNKVKLKSLVLPNPPEGNRDREFLSQY